MEDSRARKRPSPPGDDDLPQSKRQRSGSSQTIGSLGLRVPASSEDEQEHRVPSTDEQARDGLRRSLALALSHVGFATSSDEALESFLLMTETYLQSLIEDVKLFAHASRRAQPSPLDFDISLARFNLSTTALKPHLKNPVPRDRLRPAYINPLLHHPEQGKELPLLGEELSGRREKESKPYIPSSFPDFPSIHTYRCTVVDVDEVSVKTTGLKYDDGTTVGGNQVQILAESARGDSKKTREAAAIEAKQAEEALRGLVRASKINKLKEVRAVAERNRLSKERYSLWETAMRDLIEESGESKGKAAAGSGAARIEIADHSMMVNAEKVFHRKEVQRAAKKGAQKT